MRNRVTAFTLVLLSALAFLATFSEEAFAARKIKIRAKTMAEQLDRINRFQLDCLSLIRSPSEVFRSAEVFGMAPNGDYSVRVKGKLTPDVQVSFESDDVTYTKPDGSIEKLNFSLKSSTLLANEEGEFSFVIIIPRLQVATMQVLFKSELDQSYNLRLSVNDRGQFSKAELDPILDFSTKTKLCPRTRLSLSVGAAGIEMAQQLTSMNGNLDYAAVAAPSLGLNYSFSSGSKFEHLLALRTSEAALNSQEQFGSEAKFRNLAASYLIQQRSSKWVHQMSENALHPLIRYGLVARNLPTAKLSLADQIEIETPFTFKASLGAGLNLFTQSRWLGTIELDALYPFATMGGVKADFGYSVGASASYAVSKNYFAGARMAYQKDSYSYERTEGLDRSGKVDLSTFEIEFSIGVLF